MSTPSPVVVTGPPGVGKSTVCAELASELGLAAHVKADDLHRMIVSGLQWPSAATPEAHNQLLTRTRNAAAVAQNLADIGITVFVDEVVAFPEQLAIIDEALSTARWIVLTASRPALIRRDAIRAKHTALAYLDLAVPIERLLAGRATLIATDDLTPQQTAGRIMAILDRR